MVYAMRIPMHHDPMRHYLLSPYEAELLAIFRQLPESSQALVANVMAAQTGRRHIPMQPVELSLVNKSA